VGRSWKGLLRLHKLGGEANQLFFNILPRLLWEPRTNDRAGSSFGPLTPLQTSPAPLLILLLLSKKEEEKELLPLKQPASGGGEEPLRSGGGRRIWKKAFKGPFFAGEFYQFIIDKT
jgi:hypothetical protein